MIQNTIKKVTRTKPKLSTAGGTSDARFNDSLLGQEVAKIFREEIEIDRDGQFPINQRRACCLDVGSGKKSNDFVSISLPLPLS